MEVDKNEFTSLEIESEERGRERWNFRYGAAISRPQEWFNRSWKGQTGRVETFLRPKSNGMSPLEEMVGEKVTPENTIFYDVMNSEIDEFKTLDEEFTQFDQYTEMFEIMNIRESGFPDVLDYEGDGAVVISWVEMTFKNKKSGNIGTILQHIQHYFNEEGEIVREDYYFNPAQLPQ